MRLLLPALLLLAACQPLPATMEPVAGNEPPPKAEAVPVAAPPARAPTLPPEPAGIVDESALDRSVQPCDDFYKFACGGWMAKTPIPADQAQWFRSFSEITERNQATMRQILEDDAAGKVAEGDVYGKKLGDYYATCMDEQKAETASLATLREELAKIDKIKDVKQLAPVVATLHSVQVNAFFTFRQEQDFKDAALVIGNADQGGLGLPDREYYLKDDAKSVEIRKQYLAHVAKMLELAGAKPKDAQAQAASVMTIETALAKGAMSRVDRRDPQKIYHRLERTGLAAKAPHFAWDAYFVGLAHPGIQTINVATPDFFVALDGVLTRTKPAELRNYLRWHLIASAADALGKAFVDEDFRMRAVLTGVKVIKPRWKRCVEDVEVTLGQALGRPFVHATFGPDGKQSALAILEAIEKAFESNLARVSWMDGATREAAAGKLHKIENKIGYPDSWRSFDKLEIDRTSLLKNTLRALAFETQRQLDKIGKPVDRTEWLMAPSAVNAYYEASMNEMVFPAGILQPPFFHRGAGRATNFGAVGMVMGHELTHGFDDEGRQFDGFGNLREWWPAEVAKAFTGKAECVAKQYDGFTVVDGLHVNGHLTLGENIADLGGIKMAHAALHKVREGGGPAPSVAGFNEEQQFFVSVGQAWCANRRDELARVRIVTDPHSPAQYRVNGPLANLPEFAAAFSCKPGSPMAPVERCTVW